MIYELRIYTCAPGRLPALLNRFETTTLKIWDRMGIKQAGFWTTLIGESNHQLIYLLQWESLAEREEKWNAFQADPEWQAKRAESEKDAPIVANVASQLMTPDRVLQRTIEKTHPGDRRTTVLGRNRQS